MNTVDQLRSRELPVLSCVPVYMRLTPSRVHIVSVPNSFDPTDMKYTVCENFQQVRYELHRDAFVTGYRKTQRSLWY